MPQAILFDLDDTLTDLMPSLVHYAARFHGDFADDLASTAVSTIAAALLTADVRGYHPRAEVLRNVSQHLPWRTVPEVARLRSLVDHAHATRDATCGCAILAPREPCSLPDHQTTPVMHRRAYVMAITLLSERLVLRDFTLDDWPAVYAYASHPEVYRFQPWGPITPDEAREYVELAIAQAQQQPRIDYTLAIVLAATGTVLGTCGLMMRHQQFRHGEIAYFLHPDYWGQGYATEVAQRLLHFGFTTLRLHRILGTCDPRNTASARVLEKVGMQYEGRHRETMLLRDGWRDSLVYSLLEHEWPPSHGERGSRLRQER